MLLLLFSGPSALALRGHVLGKVFAGPGSGPGEFNGAAGVAVNEASGDVYVTDSGDGRVEYFTNAGVFVGEFNGSGAPTGAFSDPQSIAVDNTCRLHEEETEEVLSAGACKSLDPSDGDVYVVDAGHKVVDKFGPTGEYMGQIAEVPAGPFELGVFGVAVDATGQVRVAEVLGPGGNFAQSIDRFSSTLIYEGSTALLGVGFLEHVGLAVTRQNNLYAVLHISPVVVEVSDSGRIVNPELGPEPPSGLGVEMTTSDVYIDGTAGVERFDPGGNLIERFGVVGGALAVNSATGQVFVAYSSGMVDEYELEPPGPPGSRGTSVLKVDSDSATLAAEVDPHGASTEYVFEYGLCTTPSTCATSAYEGTAPLGGGHAGGDFEVHTVTATIQNLASHARYHARIVLHNTVGETINAAEGTEVVFVTQTVAGDATLPDGRGWELVSPPDKHGGLIQPIEEQGIIEAAISGSAVTYLSSVPTEAEPEGFSNSVQVLSARGAAGWASTDLPLPHEAPTGKAIGVGQEYRMFSDDLSFAVAQPLGPYTPFSQQTSEQTPYLRSDFTAGAGLCRGPECYRPLLSGCPAEGEKCAPGVEGVADVPPGTTFGGQSAGKCLEAGGPVACGPQVRGGTPDLAQVVLESPARLVSGAPAGLYEWSNGVLASIGESSGIHSFKAISEDGTFVVFDGKSEGLKGLLLRDVVSGETIQIDGEENTFLWASGDGRRIFYLSGARDVDECEVVVVGGLSCAQSNLTPSHPGVLGLVGASDDGSWLYFVADGAIAPNAVEGGCQVSRVVKGVRCDLYVLHFDGSQWEAPRLVSVISGEDFADWRSERVRHVARSSPDGEWLSFMSREPLTGYDNRDAASGVPDEEVFLYHATREGSLICASCNPTGARPAGIPYGELNGVASGDRVWEAAVGIAGNTPAWTPYANELSLYDSRFLGNSGRLFFDSSDALVPGDVNGGEDVYEFEPAGVGGCSESSTGFVVGEDGCVGLMSSGLSGSESGFVDASASGGDVFFLSSAKLVAGDVDSAADVYDAHECTVASRCLGSAVPVAPVCGSRDSCSGGQTPVVFGTPPSSVFSGPLNSAQVMSGSGPHNPSAKTLTRAAKLSRALKACKKGPKRKRVECVRLARKRFAPVKGGKTKPAKPKGTAEKSVARLGLGSSG